jgi:hypothetical protein
MRLPIRATLPDSADSIAGVLDHGFELYARSYWRTFGFIVLSCIPNAIAGILLGEVQTGIMGMLMGGAFGSLVTKYWWLLPFWLVNTWFLLSLYNAAYYRTGLIARGRDATFWQCIKLGFSRGFAALGVAFMSGVMVFFAFLLSALWMGLTAATMSSSMALTAGDFGAFFSIIIFTLVLLPPIILISVVLVPAMLAPCAIVLRGEGVFAALGTGFRLMGQHFWRNVVTMTVPGVLYSIAYSGLGGIVGISLYQGRLTQDSSAMNIVIQFLTIPIMALLIPLFISTVVALFSDLLLRRDGTDLQLRLDALSAGTGTSATRVGVS